MRSSCSGETRTPIYGQELRQTPPSKGTDTHLKVLVQLTDDLEVLGENTDLLALLQLDDKAHGLCVQL